jgi:asparagine synthase (glutamine-hydrolysing)
VPFLDHRLVEFVFSLDDDDKIRGGQSKYILRKSMEGILPAGVIDRKGKQGFLGGEADGWLRGPLRGLIERPMEVEDVAPITNRQAEDLIRDFKNGDRKRVQAVWNLASLNYWLHRG